MIKVMKFGGTSVGSGEAIRRTASIIMGDSTPKAVVVSAMSGITNELIALMKEPEGKAGETLDRISERHLAVARGHMSIELQRKYERLLGNNMTGLREALHKYHTSRNKQEKDVMYDSISSWGERLSSITVAYVLISLGCNAVPITSEEAGISAEGTPGNGSADLYTTSVNLKMHVLPLIEKGQTPIITGFYGIDPDGHPMTFGRGGSDYSGSVVANGLDADAIEIWTDVDGFMTADPRIVPMAKTLTEMDYNEAAELAYFGAKVLHPRTIEPARKKDLEVWVKNSFNPDGKGTRIFKMRQGGGTMLRSVAMKKDLSIVKVYSGEIVYQPGLVNKILEAVCADGVTTYAISTSLSTMAVLVPTEQVHDICERVKALKDDVEKVHVKEGVSLICAVGDGMLQTCGVSAKIFSAVAETGANVEMISEGASDVALNFVVGNDKAVGVVKLLHDMYIGG